MSVAVESALITAQERAAKDRVASANGRYAAAHRRKRGVSDPRVVDSYRSELTTAVIARDIIAGLSSCPNLSVPQRVELIELLLPTDNTEMTEVLHELREHADTALLAYGT